MYFKINYSNIKFSLLSAVTVRGCLMSRKLNIYTSKMSTFTIFVLMFFSHCFGRASVVKSASTCLIYSLGVGLECLVNSNLPSLRKIRHPELLFFGGRIGT